MGLFLLPVPARMDLITVASYQGSQRRQPNIIQRERQIPGHDFYYYFFTSTIRLVRELSNMPETYENKN